MVKYTDFSKPFFIVVRIIGFEPKYIIMNLFYNNFMLNELYATMLDANCKLPQFSQDRDNIISFFCHQEIIDDKVYITVHIGKGTYGYAEKYKAYFKDGWAGVLSAIAYVKGLVTIFEGREISGFDDYDTYNVDRILE